MSSDSSRHITLRDILHHHSAASHPNHNSSTSSSSSSTSTSTSSSPANNTIISFTHHPSSDTLELLDSSADLPLPSVWEKCLDMQTGRIYYRHRDTGSRSFCDPRIVNSANYARYPMNASLSPSDYHFSSAKPSRNASPASSDSMAFSIHSSSTPHGTNAHEIAERADPLDLDLCLRLGSNSSKQQPIATIRHSHQIIDDGEYNGMKASQSKASEKAYNDGQRWRSRANQCEMKSTTLTNSSIPAIKFEDEQLVYGSNSVGATNLQQKGTSNQRNNPMVTMGCLNCFMFVVMPRGSKQKCPSCGLLLNLNLESKLDFPVSL